MDIFAQSLLLVSVVSFALGASVLTRDVRNRLYRAFAQLCGVLAVWSILLFMDRVIGVEAEESVYFRLHLAAHLWLAPAGLAFLEILAREAEATAGWARLSWLRVAAFGAMAGTVALLLGWDLRPDVGGAVRVALLAVPSLIAWALATRLWTRWRADRRPEFVRRQGIYLGGLFVLVLSVANHWSAVSRTWTGVSNLVLVVYLFFLSRAVTQARLLNFSALLVRFLVLSSIALILTVVYSLLVAWIQGSPALFFLNSFLVSFFVVSLLEPLRSLVRSLTSRLLTQENLKLELAVSEAVRDLVGVTDPYRLAQSVLRFVETVLAPQYAAIYTLGTDGTKFRRLRWSGDEGQSGPPLTEILASHPLLDGARRLKQRGELPVLLLEQLESEIDRSASTSQQQVLRARLEGLRAFGCNLLIPILEGVREGGGRAGGPEVLGLVAVRVDAPPEPWGSNWGLLAVIYPYFEAVAASLRTLEVYARQREKDRLAELGELSAGLAHEIRNPLSAIQGAAQYLDPETLEREGRGEGKFLRIINEEVARLNSVVTQFLDYSKAERGDAVPIDLGGLVSRVVERLRPSIDPAIELRVETPREPLWVRGAPDRLQQVLVNLLQNSAQALGRQIALPLEGGGAALKRAPALIRIECGRTAGVARIAVEDNGPGIRREHLDKLFIPFFTTSPRGTGLGLPISQRIAQAHQGRIEVLSEEGRFARFSLVLPLDSGPETP